MGAGSGMVGLILKLKLELTAGLISIDGIG
jgi:hypothetical protein